MTDPTNDAVEAVAKAIQDAHVAGMESGAGMAPFTYTRYDGLLTSSQRHWCDCARAAIAAIAAVKDTP